MAGFDCIGFMQVEEALPWLPVWMCACIYAVDVKQNHSANVITWTIFKVTEALDASAVHVDQGVLEEFALLVSSREDEPELFAALARAASHLSQGTRWPD